ncbi:hypothetical protein Asal01_00108 [Fodinibius salicampi]
MGFTAISKFEVRNTLENEELFHYWYRHCGSESHPYIRRGLKLVKRSFSLEYFNHITS